MKYNYCLPEMCCANCVHSELNMYDDCICGMQPSGTTIDRGGWCEQYQFDYEASLPPKEVTPELPLILTCEGCTMYGEGICFDKGITNPKKRCSKYAEKPIDQDIRRNNCMYADTCTLSCTCCNDYTIKLTFEGACDCEHCVHSYFNNETMKPICSVDDREICDTQSTCMAAELEVIV